MDDTNKATREEPLRYFQWMFLENGLNSYIDIFFSQLNTYDIISIDDDEVSYYADVYDENTGNVLFDTKHKKNFSKELERDLVIQYRHTLKLIDSAIANISFQDNNSTRFFNLQVNILNEIKTNSNKYIEKYPFITTILNDIALHVKKVQAIPLGINKLEAIHNSKFTIGENIDTDIIESTIVDNPVQQLVVQIFGYFKDRMELEFEYNRLIEHIVNYVETQILPDENFQKFRHIHNIKNEEIRFTFFVLYSLNKKKINRKMLCQFITLSFENFIDVKESYLYGKLSEAPIFESYVPEFIRKFDK